MYVIKHLYLTITFKDILKTYSNTFDQVYFLKLSVSNNQIPYKHLRQLESSKILLNATVCTHRIHLLKRDICSVCLTHSTYTYIFVGKSSIKYLIKDTSSFFFGSSSFFSLNGVIVGGSFWRIGKFDVLDGRFLAAGHCGQNGGSQLWIRQKVDERIDDCGRFCEERRDEC